MKMGDEQSFREYTRSKSLVHRRVKNRDRNWNVLRGRNLQYSYRPAQSIHIRFPSGRVYAILQCASSIYLRLYRNERISIFTGNQATLFPYAAAVQFFQKI